MVTLYVFIWAVVPADLALKVAIAPQRLKYVRQHWLDVMIVLVPSHAR